MRGLRRCDVCRGGLEWEGVMGLRTQRVKCAGVGWSGKGGGGDGVRDPED